MTEPVIGVGGVRGTDRNATGGGIFKRGKGERHPLVTEDDNVEISDEARSRATGGKSEAGRDHGADAGD